MFYHTILLENQQIRDFFRAFTSSLTKMFTIRVLPIESDIIIIIVQPIAFIYEVTNNAIHTIWMEIDGEMKKLLSFDFWQKLGKALLVVVAVMPAVPEL